MFWFVPTAKANTFMPPAASEVAQHVNSLYAFMLIASVISFVLLIGGMIYFVYKYKRKTANDKTPYISHNHTLEFVWSFIPFVIFMICFAWPANADELRVPAFTAYMLPNPDSAKMSEASGITRWMDEVQRAWSWFLVTSATGH